MINFSIFLPLLLCSGSSDYVLNINTSTSVFAPEYSNDTLEITGSFPVYFSFLSYENGVTSSRQLNTHISRFDYVFSNIYPRDFDRLSCAEMQLKLNSFKVASKTITLDVSFYIDIYQTTTSFTPSLLGSFSTHLVDSFNAPSDFSGGTTAFNLVSFNQIISTGIVYDSELSGVTNVADLNYKGGYDTGFNIGYEQGFNEGSSAHSPNIIEYAFSGVASLLDIEIFPDFKLIYVAGFGLFVMLVRFALGFFI